MSQEAAAPDVLELTRQTFAAANSGDFDAMMAFYGPDSVWDIAPSGLGTYTGETAIRNFFEDWIGGLESWRLEIRELRDLGNGIVLVIAVQSGFSAGGGPQIRLRHTSLFVWSGEVIAQAIHYRDLHEALTAAERLGKEQG